MAAAIFFRVGRRRKPTGRPPDTTGHQLLKTLLSRICGRLPSKWARDVGADYLIIDYRLASAGVLETAQSRGFAAMVWTVNEAQEIQRFLSNDMVYGIITNYPDIAVKLRSEQI